MDNKIHLHQKPFVSFSQNKTLEKFIADTLSSLREVIEITANAFYQETEHDQEVMGFDKMFGGIERTWVGIFNNAVVRTDATIATLQEFKVFSDEKEEGRCDFLFQVNKDNQIFNVYTEAKQAIHDSMSNLTAQNDYTTAFKQLNTYYEQEKKWCKCPNFQMVIRFEFINKSEELKLVQDAANNWDFSQDDGTNFLSLYYYKKRGVLVYGKIIFKEVDAKS